MRGGALRTCPHPLKPFPPAAAIGPRHAERAGANDRRVVTFIVMVFGMFMAILDIQIVSASLSEIQAGISASADEIPWVQTSYLIAEVIMIPLSGFLSRALSTRYLFVISAAGFTLMSIMCSTATSIEEMIVWRALQGFIGGGMIPTVFASAFTIFPKSKQPAIQPIIGLVATLAPTIGPTIGGYLTDLFSWHWLFLVNVLPGIVVTVVSWFLIDFDKPDFKLLRKFDWIGFLTMAGFLGALEYILEEGPTDNWFDSDHITIGVVFSATSAVFFFWRVLTAEHPVVDLSAFKDRNFTTGSLFSFVLGIGLYGLTLSLSRLSRPRARLFRASDRRDDVRHRHLHVSHGAGLRQAHAARRRSAPDARARLHRLRAGDVSDLVDDGRMGFL